MPDRALGLLSLLLLGSLAGCDDENGSRDAGASDAAAPDAAGSDGGAEDAGGGGAEDAGGGDADAGPRLCAHRCDRDADCFVAGSDIGLVCRDFSCTSPDAAPPCTGDRECVALRSGWTTACTTGGGCGAAETCVSVDGQGRCAARPTSSADCESLGLETTVAATLDGVEVFVCGQPRARCGDGVCFLPCRSASDCPSADRPVCDTSTGRCECGSDAHCATLGTADRSICNAGTCGCTSNQHCMDGAAGDLCNEGSCGCSEDAACDGVVGPYDEGTYRCVAP